MDDSILFVDDEPNILSSLRRELTAWAGSRRVRLLFASTPADALALADAEQERLALVVSDFRMPDMNGVDLLLAIQARIKRVMSILLTGYTETEEMMKAIKAGVFSFILKPWNAEYLRAEIEKALFVRGIKKENEQYLENIQKELYLAGVVQRSLLRVELPRTDGVRFQLEYRPVPNLYCGGDYYDVITLPDGRYLVLIGDVAGHGLRASFFTGMLKAVIYPDYVGRHRDRLSPADFLFWLNARMMDDVGKVGASFITFCASVIDMNRRELTTAMAGHPSPYLVRDRKALRVVSLAADAENAAGTPPVMGPALGSIPDATYRDTVVPLSSGDVLVWFTDGLIEVGSPGAMPDRSVLERVLAENPFSRSYSDDVFGAMKKASGSTEFSDDLTFIAAYLT